MYEKDVHQYSQAIGQRLKLISAEHHDATVHRADWAAFALTPLHTIIALACLAFCTGFSGQPGRLPHSVTYYLLLSPAIIAAAAAPLLLLWFAYPSRAFRYAVVVIHVLLVLSLIHMTGGHSAPVLGLFLALAIVALYREWPLLLVVGGLIVVHDALRVVAFPLPIPGLLAPPAYAWVEHMLLAAGLATFLALLGLADRRDLRNFARRQAELEAMTEILPTTAIRLKASEARFRSLSAHSPIGILEVDSAGCCTYTNERWLAITGLTAEQSLGNGWMKAIHPEDRQNVLLQWAKAAAAKTELETEFRILKDGEIRWSRLRNTVLQSVETGQPVFVGAVEDVTEFKRVEADMQRAKETAEGASLSKTLFLANMSHEIRTPMTAILGYTDLLIRQDLPPQQQQEFLQTIRRNSQHLLSLINDILDISKIEANKLVVENIPCSPIAIVTEVAALMRPRALEQKLCFDVEFQGALPVAVQTDPTRLRQILVNLVGNALKFTKTGSVHIHVMLAEAGPSGSPLLRFDIVDTGIGLSLTQQTRLFQPFTQADPSMTRRFGGTGLGLAISKALALKLGGDIHVSSQVGKGSTFTLLIDPGAIAMVQRENFKYDPSTLPTQTTPDIATACLRGRVLVAEDGPDNQQLIKFYLTEAGLHVDLTDNGLGACEQATAAARHGKRYDVILMDMQMPQLDGYKATQRLRAQGYDGPIVALTAHAMTGDRDKCLAAGCNDYATKPIVWADLLDKIAPFLTRDTSAPARRQEEAPEPHHDAAPGNSAAAPPSDALVSTLASTGKLSHLVERFVGKLPERIAALQDALRAHDHTALATLSHQLKGAAAGYGFPSITDAARSLETAVKDSTEPNAVAQIQPLLDELIALCHRAAAHGPAAPAESALPAQS